MTNKIIQKGQHGYLKYRKKRVLIETIVMFAMSFVIFISGYLYRGTKANICSILAVLALLPASKSLVSLIMYLRTPRFDEVIYNRLHESVVNNEGLFELYFTTYKKNYPVNALFCKKDCIIAFTEFHNFDTRDLESHINDMLKQNSFKDVTVKVFTDIEKFEERANKLVDNPSSEALTKLMKDIIL